METVYRAAAMFLFLWIITRVVGRSTIGELSTFSLVLFITMGDMVQQSVTGQDYSFTGGLLAIAVFTVLTTALSWINSRWPRVRAITHGVAVVVVNNGEPIVTMLRRERLSIDDLMAAARLKGFERISDIRLAVLEATGQISFFRREDNDGNGADGHRDSGESGADEKPAIG